MKLTFSPMRQDDRLNVTRSGDTLTINGEGFDLSVVPEGATLPAEAINSAWFGGPVERIGGVLNVTLILPHGANAPQETRHPAPFTLTGDGPVSLPTYDVEPTDEY
ncbi:hypothetical protein [Oceaniovalibus sp. ACAM 378]|uniref:hypothetical protein n=1 Tax=Oceaniovalibus sp. ACAM 378 TaxID=2599923 RepID=UPI0011D9793A|nr:hypothetical protein [Oceaniovalibus sp. ACAM 378]TYB83977.1 hypothetical protein FQ320_23445 [Oceaniovalibus sp. ACAM 378]